MAGNASRNKCPACSLTVPLGSPEGLCPRCLLLGSEFSEEDTFNLTTLRDASPKTDESCLKSGEGRLDDGFLAEEAPSERHGFGVYRLIEEIGEGGFGVVWRAEQSNPLCRTVAVKLLRPGFDSIEISARFALERQALALMDHPGIARIFDAGETEDGCLYFAMELVEGGRALTTYCDEERLNLRERLEIFGQVCEAVNHAHQKGVIHRDLKPSNILVGSGDRGRTVPKVIDFGIAKAVGSELSVGEAIHQTLGILGTPIYMSPEQAAVGRGVDTRSDIYSLGVILYELLIGRPPLHPEVLNDSSLAEFLRIVREEDPVKPSTKAGLLADGAASRVAADRATVPRRLTGMLRGDLDWIVLKALEKDRERRYASVMALCEDIRRHLAGEPVAAAPPGTWYRAGKFVRKHRSGVAAAATVSMALLMGAIGTTWKWREAVEARRQADGARDAAEKLANENLFNLKESLEPLGRLDLLDQLSLSLESYYGSLPAALKDRSVARNESVMWQRRGEVLMASGKIEEAIDRFRIALESREALLHSDSGKEDAAEDMSVSCRYLGESLLYQGRIDQAMPYLRKSVEWAGIAVRARPGERNALTVLGAALAHLGDAFEQMGDSRSALEAYKEAGSLFDSLATSAPTDRPALRNLALSHHRMAISKKRQGDLTGALSSIKDHREIVSRLLTMEPENSEFLRAMGAAMAQEAVILSLSGDAGKAEKLATEAVRVLDLLCQRSPTNHRFVSGMSQAAGQLGEVLLHSDRTGEAQSILMRACDIAVDLTKRHPSNAEFTSSAGNLLGLLALCLRLNGDLEGAMTAVRSGAAHYEKLLEGSGNHSVWRCQLLLCRAQLAICLLESGDTKGASTVIEESLSTVKMVIASSSESRQWGDLFSEMLTIQANILSATGRVAEANAIMRPIALQGSSESAADNLAIGRERIIALQQMGDLATRLGTPEEALRHYQEALDVALLWEQKAPHDPGHRKRVGIARLKTADAFLSLRDFVSCREAIEVSLGIFEDLVGSQTGVSDLPNLLMSALELKLDLYEALGDFEEAIPIARRALELSEAAESLTSPKSNIAERTPAAMGRLVEILTQAGNLEEAVAVATKACAITAELHAADSGSVRLRWDMAISMGQLAKALWSNGNIDGAIATIEDAIDQFDFLLTSQRTPEFMKDSAIAWETLASFQIESNQLAKAANSQREALARRRSRSEASPESPLFQRSLAVSLDQLAVMEDALGRRSEAETLTREAITILEALSTSKNLVIEDVDWLERMRSR